MVARAVKEEKPGILYWCVYGLFLINIYEDV